MSGFLKFFVTKPFFFFGNYDTVVSRNLLISECTDEKEKSMKNVFVNLSIPFLQDYFIVINFDFKLVFNFSILNPISKSFSNMSGREFV